GQAEFAGGEVDFNEANFASGELGFRSAEFTRGEIRFHRARFYKGCVDFRGAKFDGGRVDLSTPSDYKTPPMFDAEVLEDLPVGLVLCTQHPGSDAPDANSPTT